MKLIIMEMTARIQILSTRKRRRAEKKQYQRLRRYFSFPSEPILSKLLVQSPTQQTKGKKSALPASSPWSCTVPTDTGLNTCYAATCTTLMPHSQTALLIPPKMGSTCWGECKIWLFPQLLYPVCCKFPDRGSNLEQTRNINGIFQKPIYASICL